MRDERRSTEFVTGSLFLFHYLNDLASRINKPSKFPDNTKVDRLIRRDQNARML